MKKQYITPQTQSVRINVCHYLLAASGDGPDIIDKGEGGDGSDMHAKYHKYDDFGNVFVEQARSNTEAAGPQKYSVWE